jgi:hypothetical protein
MLARCCLMTEAESCPSSNLTRSLMEQCASECVAAAQSTVFAVHQSQSHNFSVLPAWWYRVSYMYTAAMVLAVSTLRPDLFPRSTTQNAWDNVLVLFQTHEHLSDSVQVCRVALQRIFSRIEQMQGVSSSTFVFKGTLLTNRILQSGNIRIIFRTLPPTLTIFLYIILIVCRGLPTSKLYIDSVIRISGTWLF